GLRGNAIACRERAYLIGREARAAGLGEIAERDVSERVTRRANVLVNLKAALQRATIIGAEWAVEGPVHMPRRQRRRRYRRGLRRCGCGSRRRGRLCGLGLLRIRRGVLGEEERRSE